ncbi:MAG: hypothetical protein HYT36_03750 [Candidatus Staskawiczbacteria bacterium]|nr:hypothetical protein [Candidatus Staskawiczbacteria bacterium]
MALQVRRKERESSHSLVHRFSKVVRQSGVLVEARKKQFRKRPKSALAKKKSMLRKEKIVKEKKMLDKMSKPR